MLPRANEIINRSTHPLHLFSGVLIFLVLSTGFAPTAMASVTYTYVGNAYNQSGGTFTCPPVCGITGSFTVAAPLTPNANYYFTPLSFSFTDGLTTFTPSNVTGSAFGVVTNSLGQIVGWNMNWLTPGDEMFSGTNPPGCVGCSVVDGSFSPSSFAEILNSPGTWTGPIANSIYTYTGQPYSPVAPAFCNGTYIPVCTQLAVTGYFTTASPLGNNLNGYVFTPSTFSFTDGAGFFALTSADVLAISYFEVSTDGYGNITSWTIGLANYATDCVSVSGFECLGTYYNLGASGDFSAYAFNLNTPSKSYGGGLNFGTPGRWTGPIASTSSGNLRQSLTPYTDSIAPLVITWNQAFPDTNYTAACTTETTAGDFLLPTITSRSTNGMQVSPSDGGPPTGVLNCFGLPDFDSSGLRHGRTPFSGFPPSVTVNWNQAFSDTNYTVVCAVETAGSFASGFTSMITTVTPGSVNVVNGGYDTGKMHCLAVPDSDFSNLRHTRVPVSSSPSTVTVPWTPFFPDSFYVSVCSDEAPSSADSAIAILANSKLPGSLQVIPELPSSGRIVHCIASQNIVTPESIEGDVTRFLQSGAIKNAGEATSLLSKLVAAAAARAAGNCSTAAKIYQAFINALNAQSGKGVVATAAAIMIANAQYLIAHCP